MVNTEKRKPSDKKKLVFKKKTKFQKLLKPIKEKLYNLYKLKILTYKQYKYYLSKVKKKIFNYIGWLNKQKEKLNITNKNLIPLNNQKRINLDYNGIVHILCTNNNTIITATNNKGNTIFWASGGTEGFKGGKKGSSYAAHKIAKKIAKKLLKRGINKIKVKIKGFGQGRRSAIKGLKTTKLKINIIQDVTPIPYNGCRPQKRRRK